MHVVSARLHYFLVSPNIIWLPWQRPLTKKYSTNPSSALKAKILIEKICEKIAKIGPVYPKIFD